MKAILNDHLIEIDVKNRFVRPLPFLPLDICMEELLQIEQSVKDIFDYPSITAYVDESLGVDGESGMLMVTNEIHNLAYRMDNVMRQINEGDIEFDMDKFSSDPYLRFFYKHVVPTFRGNECEYHYIDFVKGVHSDFNKYRRTIEFKKDITRQIQQMKNVDVVMRFFDSVDKRRNIDRTHCIEVTPKVSNFDHEYIRLFSRWLSLILSKYHSKNTKFWIFGIDYHTRGDVYFNIHIANGEISEIIKEIAKEAIVSRNWETTDSRHHIKNLLTYTYRKHHLLSPVPDGQRVVYRSFS